MESEKNQTTRHERTEELLNFIKKYDKSPKQGTSDWLKQRTYKIGGSEMATLQGVNQYETLATIVSSKLGLREFKGDIKTRWGKVFESQITKYTEYRLHTKLHGAEIYIADVNPNQSYSPDGLGVVECTDELAKIMGIPVEEKPSHVTALFEFKCPFNRLPHATNIVNYYLPQVLTGLDTISPTSIGVFSEAVFRRCEYTDLSATPAYDKTLTPNDLKTPVAPLAYGFILFILNPSIDQQIKDFNAGKITDMRAADTIKTYILKLERLTKLFDENTIDITDYEKINKTNPYPTPTTLDDIGDLGSAPLSCLEVVFELFDDNILSTYYSTMVINSTVECRAKMDPLPFVDYTRADEYLPTNIDNLAEQLNTVKTKVRSRDMKIYGILPWKLLKCYYKYVKKEVGYVSKWQNQINDIINIVTQCKHSNPEITRENYEKIKPKLLKNIF